MRIMGRYQRTMRDLMKEYGISPVTPDSPRPAHVVPKDAGFAQVLRHTDYYVGRGNDNKTDATRHYRYRRYMEVLRRVEASKGRIAHVDIGCGAGLFSWVFLDRANAKRFPLGCVELYGLDHSPAMVRLAQELRNRLMKYIPDYPELHYCSDPELLLRKLTDNHVRVRTTPSPWVMFWRKLIRLVT